MRHLRTEGAIRSRLERLGLITGERTVATVEARSEEALARAEQAYLDQSEYLEIYAPDCGPDDNEYGWEISRGSEEADIGGEYAESYVGEPERDLNDVDWSDQGDDLDSRDWERIMGGPEDDEIQRFQEEHTDYEESRED
jgi:hypothetical protein